MTPTARQWRNFGVAFLAVVGALAIVLLLIVAGADLGSRAPAAAAGTPPNTDPRHGWVSVRGSNVGKVCDGLNLVYRDSSAQGRAVAVSVTDPQCAKETP